MSAAVETCLVEGDLAGALARARDGVRDDPAGAAPRVLLFQLLCVAGDWERARTQLDVAAELDAGTLLMAQTCRELMRSERYRETVFAGERAPLVLGQPPAWLGSLVQALARIAAADGRGARALVDDAFERASARAGTLDGDAFDWLADADMRLGPVLEAMIDGRYYWVPFEQLSRLVLTEPVDLRDLVWLPAEFRWRNGGETVGFVPARYPGRATLDDPALALARRTEWDDAGAGLFVGAGQRMLASDRGEYPLLETREIVFSQAEGRG